MIWQWPKWPKMVYVIKDTVDIYYFCKNWHETAQEDLLFKRPPVSLPQIENSCIFLSKLQKLSPIQNLDKESWVKTWSLGQWEHANPWGSPGEDYNWLIHYLVLTICLGSLFIISPCFYHNLQLWVLVKLENKKLSSTAVCTTFTFKKCYYVSSWFKIYCCSVPRVLSFSSKIWNWAKAVVLLKFMLNKDPDDTAHAVYKEQQNHNCGKLGKLYFSSMTSW